jgi:uncharacterized protein (DUF2147 family)
MRALLVAVALLMASAAPAEARGSKRSSSSKSSKKSGPVCNKGKACGNSCIAKTAMCHQGKGTATNADEKTDDKDDQASEKK